ncbi:MAG: hypothetical protein HQK53_07255, partial [Oligoflexia bacterium]|nr:hypothetical protein [Oligoflexia bacterium]
MKRFSVLLILTVVFLTTFIVRAQGSAQAVKYVIEHTEGHNYYMVERPC